MKFLFGTMEILYFSHFCMSVKNLKLEILGALECCLKIIFVHNFQTIWMIWLLRCHSWEKRCMRTIEVIDMVKFYNLKSFARCRESGIIVIGQCLWVRGTCGLTWWSYPNPSCLEPVEKAVLIAFLIFLMTLALVTSACSLLTAHSDYRAIDLHLFQVNIEVLSMSF
jgi:hypothetical protein